MPNHVGEVYFVIDSALLVCGSPWIKFLGRPLGELMSGHPASSQGPSDCCSCLQSDALTAFDSAEHFHELRRTFMNFTAANSSFKLH